MLTFLLLLVTMHIQRASLELKTMMEKCKGWKEEVEKLLPLEEEVKKVRKENEELAEQVTLLVEAGEHKEPPTAAGGGGGGSMNMMDYDAIIKRMTELQDTRVVMEEELHQLREERSAILQENASLREGSHPQKYANLKVKHESVVRCLQETESEFTMEKTLNSALEVTIKELELANMELQQKLSKATDPDLLKTVQERMVRYKKERDTAKTEFEDVKAQLVVATVEAVSSRDALANHVSKETDRLQYQLELKDKEITELRERAQRYESRSRTYREERNSCREMVKQLKYQLQHIQEVQGLPVTPKLEGAESTEEEVSYSPLHEYQYDSPTLDFPSAAEHHTTEQPAYQHQHRDSDTPTDGATSPHYRYRSEPYTQPKAPKPDSCLYTTVKVMTKEGGVEMDIQKPSVQLNPKQKPSVVVKRESGYEAGALMYVGRHNGKEVAGVWMELQIHSKY